MGTELARNAHPSVRRKLPEYWQCIAKPDQQLGRRTPTTPVLLSHSALDDVAPQQVCGALAAPQSPEQSPLRPIPTTVRTAIRYAGPWSAVETAGRATTGGDPCRNHVRPAGPASSPKIHSLDFLRGSLQAPAFVAQGIEHRSPKAGVAGSNPAGGTKLCRSVLGVSLGAEFHSALGVSSRAVLLSGWDVAVPTRAVTRRDHSPGRAFRYWLVHHPHKRPASVRSAAPTIHRTTSVAIRRRSLGVRHTYRALRPSSRIVCPIRGLDRPSNRSHVT